MILENILLKISTPTEPIRPGRGFYQLEEDILFVQVGQYSDRQKFFSYLESDNIRFDFDRHGRLIFVEVGCSKRSWENGIDLTPPKIVEPADIRFLDFRQKITLPRFITNDNKSILKIEFGNCDELLNYYLAENIIASIDSDSHLQAVWIDKITEDMAGKKHQSLPQKQPTA